MRITTRIAALVAAGALTVATAGPVTAGVRSQDEGSVTVGIGSELAARAYPCPLVLPHYAIWRDMPVICFPKRGDSWRLEQPNLSGRNYTCRPVGGVALAVPFTQINECPVLRTLDMGDHVRVYGQIPGGLENSSYYEETLIDFRIVWLP